MKYLIFLYLLFLTLFTAECQARQVTMWQDTSLTVTNAVTALRINELELEDFDRREGLGKKQAADILAFYTNRNHQYAWLNEDGLTEQAQSLWNLYENFLNYSGDSSLYSPDLHGRMEALLDPTSPADPIGTTIWVTELRLTRLFLDFVELAYKGKVNPEDLQWHIPRKKVSAVEVLNKFVSANGREPEGIFPINPQYLLLREKLLEFRQLQDLNWPAISSKGKNLYRLKDTSFVIPIIKERLYRLGDLIAADTSKVFDGVFEVAVANFQRRHGLADDGIIGPAFMAAINVPVEKRIEQMLINMERLRWMPLVAGGKRVVVNIPEFRLHVYDNEEEVLGMDIVVGKAANRTVIFSDRIKHVVFSPYWNIPRSIIRKEIVPGMDKDPRFLARNQMEITGQRNSLPVIRQKPGGKNALGRVKFIFPNRYNIYLHDTPSKGLFGRTKRAFSHGCIRVAKPAELAMYLLGDQAEWSGKTVRRAMYAGKEKWVPLTSPVPVFIGYFTSWVDPLGQLQFREDIYGHDKKVAAHLF